MNQQGVEHLRYNPYVEKAWVIRYYTSFIKLVSIRNPF